MPLIPGKLYAREEIEPLLEKSNNSARQNSGDTGYSASQQRILAGLGGGILSSIKQQTPAVRGPIPEDSARNLFQSLFESLVSATPEDRKRAVEMLILAYDLPI